MKTNTVAVIAACLASGGLAAPTKAVSSQLSQQDIAALQDLANFKGDLPLNARQTNGLLEGLTDAMAAKARKTVAKRETDAKGPRKTLKARQLDIILGLLSSQSGGQQGGEDHTDIHEANIAQDLSETDIFNEDGHHRGHHWKRQLDILLDVLDSQSGGQRGGSDHTDVHEANIGEELSSTEVVNDDAGHHRLHWKRQLDILLDILDAQSGGQRGGSDDTHIEEANEVVRGSDVAVENLHHKRQLDVLLNILDAQSGGQRGGHDDTHVEDVNAFEGLDEVQVHNHHHKRQLDILLNLLDAQSGGQRGGHDDTHVEEFNSFEDFDGVGIHNHHRKRQLDVILDLLSAQSGGQQGGHDETDVHEANISEVDDVVNVENDHDDDHGHHGHHGPGPYRSYGGHYKRQLDVLLNVLESQSGGQQGGHDDTHVEDFTEAVSDSQSQVQNIHTRSLPTLSRRQFDLILDVLSSQSGGQQGGEDDTHIEEVNEDIHHDEFDVFNDGHWKRDSTLNRRQLDVILGLLSAQSGGQQGGHDETHAEEVNEFAEGTAVQDIHARDGPKSMQGGHDEVHEEVFNEDERVNQVVGDDGFEPHHAHNSPHGARPAPAEGEVKSEKPKAKAKKGKAKKKGLLGGALVPGVLKRDAPLERRQLDVILGLLSSQSGGQQGGHDDTHEELTNIAEHDDLVSVLNDHGHGHGYRHHKRQLDVLLNILDSQSGGQRGGHDETDEHIVNEAVDDEVVDVENIDDGHGHGHGGYHHGHYGAKRGLERRQNPFLVPGAAAGAAGLTNAQMFGNGLDGVPGQVDNGIDGVPGQINDALNPLRGVRAVGRRVGLPGSAAGAPGLTNAQMFGNGQDGVPGQVDNGIDGVPGQINDAMNPFRGARGVGGAGGLGRRADPPKAQDSHPEEALNNLLALVGVNGPPKPGVTKDSTASDAADTLSKLGKLSKSLTNNMVGVDVQDKDKTKDKSQS
ncbi:hypothetical protein CDD81_2229 [Ophiocordyceps australis]|uniref:Uncharacterized protein n=1 Tax=Ophiocordyceps australis TaxID=1399860 RepID=A0A2C5XB17_9HYPO|nr:hypothetical protein CDD81_2229 [Ophiocordyceps australis]